MQCGSKGLGEVAFFLLTEAAADFHARLAHLEQQAWHAAGAFFQVDPKPGDVEHALPSMAMVVDAGDTQTGAGQVDGFALPRGGGVAPDQEAGQQQFKPGETAHRPGAEPDEDGGRAAADQADRSDQPPQPACRQAAMWHDAGLEHRRVGDVTHTS